MRVINRDQLLAALAHRALGGKEIFGRGFVSNRRVGGNVSRPINGLRRAVRPATDYSATFARRFFAGMGDELVEMVSGEIDCHTLEWVSF